MYSTMHLEIMTTDESMRSMCIDYWEHDWSDFTYSVSKLAKKNNLIPNRVTKLVNENCIAESTEISCSQCFLPYIYENRQDFANSSGQKEWTCEECKDVLRQTEEEQKIEALFTTRERNFESPISPELISPRNAILLLAFLQFGTDEHFYNIGSFDSIKTGRLSPYGSIDTDIMQELWNSRIIGVDPSSDPSAIQLNDAWELAYYLYRVKWEVICNQWLADFFESLKKRVTSKNFASEELVAIAGLAKEVALAECLAYLEFTLKEHGLSYDFGSKTFSVLKTGLENFSVAQMYSFIWSASTNASAFQARNRVSRDHAAKTVVWDLERKIERALVNKWEIKSYWRHYKLPQSILSRILFNSILWTDDGWFNIQIDHLLESQSVA